MQGSAQGSGLKVQGLELQQASVDVAHSLGLGLDICAPFLPKDNCPSQKGPALPTCLERLVSFNQHSESRGQAHSGCSVPKVAGNGQMLFSEAHPLLGCKGKNSGKTLMRGRVLKSQTESVSFPTPKYPHPF